MSSIYCYLYRPMLADKSCVRTWTRRANIQRAPLIHFGNARPGARGRSPCLPLRRPSRPQSKRQPVVELPRLRLPLPERTGSDRDELRCPHGFVDRAYSVFLLRLRCCELLGHFCCYYCDELVMRPPPLLSSDPSARRAFARIGFEVVVRGYEPSGRSTRPALPMTSGGMSLLPAVEVRKAARR